MTQCLNAECSCCGREVHDRKRNEMLVMLVEAILALKSWIQGHPPPFVNEGVGAAVQARAGGGADVANGIKKVVVLLKEERLETRCWLCM